LKKLISQVSDQIVVVIVEFVHGQAEIAVVKESQHGLRTRDEHVTAYVKFAFVNEKRIGYVLLYDTTQGFARIGRGG
jgi:hypothetical protein